jgi:hypothetical protein
MMRAKNAAQSAALKPPQADGGVLLALGPVSTASLLCPQIHETSAVFYSFRVLALSNIIKTSTPQPARAVD